jgi:hypothetical protein
MTIRLPQVNANVVVCCYLDAFLQKGNELVRLGPPRSSFVDVHLLVFDKIKGSWHLES